MEVDGLPGIYRSVAELKAAEVAETEIVVASDPPPGALVQPTPQLNRISDRASRDPARVPLRTFLSYCHDNRRAKNLFVQNLAIMQAKNLITTWHDGMIEIGKDWKKEKAASVS